ncbi:MAG TPA: hypothetical protein VI548_05255 [Chitinophagaceae bacterium]|nr:hypothetical protein [Chitinophagaceae bacterium]
MKKLIQLSSFLFLFFYACNNADKSKELSSENDIDAARNFIRAALDGDYENGKKMMVSDSTNFQYFEEYEKLHTKMDAAEKKKYQGSSINVHAITPVNDSVTIIIYSNSYKNDHDTLKLIKTHGQWLVDLKYLFNHDMDTLQYHSNKTDSLK